IRDRMLTQALQDAYRGLLMTGRHAVGFLFLDLPADHLDVNVHPTKAEVRFRDPERLQAFITETIRARLQSEDLTGHLRGPVTAARPKPPAAEPTFDFAPLPESPSLALPPPRPATPVPAPAPIRGADRQTPPEPVVVRSTAESSPRPRREGN